MTLVITYCLVKSTYFCAFEKLVPLNGILFLMIYSLFDVRVDVILIANKNKTSYDALSVVVLFISSARISNIFLLDDLVLSDRLSLFIIESNIRVNISFISL